MRRAGCRRCPLRFERLTWRMTRSRPPRLTETLGAMAATEPGARRPQRPALAPQTAGPATWHSETRKITAEPPSHPSTTGVAIESCPPIAIGPTGTMIPEAIATARIATQAGLREAATGRIGTGAASAPIAAAAAPRESSAGESAAAARTASAGMSPAGTNGLIGMRGAGMTPTVAGTTDGTAGASAGLRPAAQIDGRSSREHSQMKLHSSSVNLDRLPLLAPTVTINFSTLRVSVYGATKGPSAWLLPCWRRY